MNIFFTIMQRLLAREPVNNDPIAHMSLRERADLPTWHEKMPDPAPESECCR